MKKRWEEPKILVQQFMANEYVAACGVENKVYKFECNAGIDNPGYHYRVYLNDGSELTGIWSAYGPCGATHDASTKDEFLSGYMDDIYTDENDKIQVIIWTDGGTDIHCTKNLNMSSWVTAKS